LSALVDDLVAGTAAEIAAHAPGDAEAVRLMPPLVRMGTQCRAELTELRQFLFRDLYRHPQVALATARARTVVTELFDAYTAQPREMPVEYADNANTLRSVADYVAGMTDRFALREHHRLTGRRAFEA
jgi:dGTPase